MAKSGFTVLKPGVLSLIQDMGRTGYGQLGISEGGAMDPWAFIIANRLCRNPDNCPAIEISVGGLQLRAEQAMKIALTGANMPIQINGVRQGAWQSLDVSSGDVISIGFAEQGLRAYLAVHSGFHIPEEFGSTSTVCREGIGGLTGKPLQGGDYLPCQRASEPMPNLRLAEQFIPQYDNNLEIRVIAGYQYQQFSQQQLSKFFEQTYQVGQLADRMGYRLQGQPITIEPQAMYSEGISYGAIQVPGDGLPIIMLNDRQTIGGYPKLGSVLRVDGAKLAQLRPGDKVRFSLITLEEAAQINKQYAQSFTRIAFQSIKA